MFFNFGESGPVLCLHDFIHPIGLVSTCFNMCLPFATEHRAWKWTQCKVIYISSMLPSNREMILPYAVTFSLSWHIRTSQTSLAIGTCDSLLKQRCMYNLFGNQHVMIEGGLTLISLNHEYQDQCWIHPQILYQRCANTQRIHVWYTYIYHKNSTIHVGKYTIHGWHPGYIFTTLLSTSKKTPRRSVVADVRLVPLNLETCAPKNGRLYCWMATRNSRASTSWGKGNLSTII